MSDAQSPRAVPRQSPRVMVGCVLLLFSALMAVIFILLGSRPLLVALMLLPFAICGLVCLLVKELTSVWCGWAFFLTLSLCDLDLVGQLLWAGYIRLFLALALVFYTAWALRDRLWGSTRRRLSIGLWLCGAAACFSLRWLGRELYGTPIPIPAFATDAEMSRYWFRYNLGSVLLALLPTLFFVLVSVALSALFYAGGRLLSKKRS